MDTGEFLTNFGRWKDVVTTFVAVIAIIVVVVQIKQARLIENEKLKREQNAARATLSLTLAALDEYGRSMTAALARLEHWAAAKGEASPPVYDGPQLGSDTVVAVQKVISAYPGQHVSRALAAILGEVQVLQSRSREFGSDERSVREWRLVMHQNVLLAANVVARCQALYDFAREGTDYAEPSREQVKQVLMTSRVPEHRFARVWTALSEYSDNDNSARGFWRRIGSWFAPAKS